MLIDSYLAYLQEMIAASRIVAQSVLQPGERGSDAGYIRGQLLFSDGSRLHFREYIDFEEGIERLMYSYHYMDTDRRLIFRYDNVAHHSHISTHPHHKHEGGEDNVVASSPPTLAAVLEEIGRMIQST